MIAIVDYGVGNVGSLVNIFKKVGVVAVPVREPETLANAEAIVLPGVGAFDECRTRLDASGLLPTLEQAVLHDSTPLLGICLGMQLLTRRSDEGELPGLGWLDAEAVGFSFSDVPQRKVPHIGWNRVDRSPGDVLFAGVEEPMRFYFLHSYHLVTRDTEVLATSEYGYEFPCAIRSGNIFGVQFHPEKSHRFGMRLLHNFALLAA